MLSQFLVAGAASVCNIIIHALVMTSIVRVVQAIAVKKNILHPTLLLVGIMIAVVSVLMGAHVVEVVVWSVVYGVVDAAPPNSNLLYFAFVNYTTLGYGDILPVKEWQLLGPITAMNGVLMFGWSTAVIFEVLRRTMILCFDDVMSE
jgi:hypothetical protein